MADPNTNVNEIIDRHAREAVDPAVIAAKKVRSDARAKVEAEKIATAKAKARKEVAKAAGPSCGRLHTSIDPEIKSHALKLCKQDNRSLGNYIETLIMKDLNRYELEMLPKKK